MHTRYSAAMNSLGCLVTARMAEEHDRLSLDLWEAARYDSDLQLNLFQVRGVVARVHELLRKQGLKP